MFGRSRWWSIPSSYPPFGAIWIDECHRYIKDRFALYLAGVEKAPREENGESMGRFHGRFLGPSWFNIQQLHQSDFMVDKDGEILVSLSVILL